MVETISRVPEGSGLEARDLRVNGWPAPVLVDVRLSVPRGSVLAVLGGAEAGKSLLVEVLAGIRPLDGGKVEIAGMDPVHEPVRALREVGVHLEREGFAPWLSGREQVRLHARLYGLPVRQAVDRATALLERLGAAAILDEWAAFAGPGGQRALSLVLAVLHRPSVLLLDGIADDPRDVDLPAIEALIRDERERGAAVLVTTRSAAVAARLGDRVLLLRHGRAVDTVAPANLGVDPAGALLARLAGEGKEPPRGARP